MTYQEVKRMVEGFGFPCAYYQFQEGTGQQPPFICWYFTGSNDLQADDRNYQRIRSLTIELYVDNKDFEAEEAIERKLDELCLPYEKDDDYIASERMYQTTYEMDVVITSTKEESEDA